MDDINNYIESFLKKNNSKKPQFEIKFGKVLNDFKFDLNIKKIEFLNLIKEVKNLTKSENIKYYSFTRYLHNNLQLDAYINGIQKCTYKKAKDILDVTMNKYKYDMKIISSKNNILPSHIFTCTQNYESEYKVESIVIDNNKLYKIVFNQCIYSSDYIVYQINIIINNSIKNYKLVCNNIIDIIKLINNIN